MPATLPIQIGERTVTVRELTVREVRDWLTSLEKGSAQVDAGGEFVWDDCSLQDLARMSDAPLDFFDDFAPSDLAPLREAARSLNPHFFRLRAAVAAAQAAMIRRLLPDQSSSPPSHS
jgi:hypothetical protein